MFEMLTGAVPFRRDHSSAIIHAILHDPVPSMSSVRPAISPELQRMIQKALEKDPARRWQSAADMVAELKRLGGSGAIPLSDAEGSVTQTIVMPSTSFAPRKSAKAAAVAAAVLLAAGGYAVYRTRGASPVLKPIPVLPFQVTGGEATRTIADGLTEILAAAISDYQGTSDYKGKKAGITAIAPGELASRKVATPEDARRVYGADQVITGSAHQQGDQVEFTVNLVDEATLQTTTSRTFLYDPKDPLLSRDRAVAQVAGMLNLDSAPSVRSRVTAGDTGAPSAYSAYIAGRGFLSRHDLPGNLDKAIASFTQATEQDPKYALAYAGLGEAYWWKASLFGDKESAALANQNAEKAAQLDDRLPVVHSVLGTVYLGAGRQQDAIKQFQRALELAPSNPEASRKLADVYDTMGRFKEAEDLYLASTKARPTDWYGYLLLGLFYYERERYPEAEAALTQAKTLTPDNDLVLRDLGGIYRMHGRYKEAIAEYNRALSIRSSASTYAALAGAYYYEHLFKEAVSTAETATDLDANNYAYWGNLGIYCRWAPGNEPKSAPALRRAVELAGKIADTVKSDYSVHANLAEYRARLGDAKGALSEIESIPASARGPFTTRLAIVYELTGHREKAIEVIRANLKNPASLNQIKDDPDLAAVWREGKF